MRKAFLLLALSGLLLTLALPASAQFNQFQGSWVNTDPNTDGITRLEINGPATNARVHAWGACAPQDCDWGEALGFAYGPDINADVEASAEALSVVFDSGFSQTILIIHPLGGGQLQVESLRRYTDGSGRSNTVNVYTFMREAAPPPASTLQRFFLRFTDAYLVYEPGSGTLQIATVGNVLSYGGDWQTIQMQPYLYHMRQANWQDFYWKVNTSRREVYRVRGGVFGALGGSEEVLSIQVDPVDNPDSPTRFLLRFTDAYLVHQPDTSVLQIITQGNVLSYGGDWQVMRLGPDTFHLRQQFWQDFFWQVDTAAGQAYRARGVMFGQPGGSLEPLSMMVEAVR